MVVCNILGQLIFHAYIRQRWHLTDFYHRAYFTVMTVDVAMTSYMRSERIIDGSTASSFIMKPVTFTRFNRLNIHK